MEYAIAVFDVGKTNKKLLIYDRDLNILNSTYRVFPTIDRDGVELEDVESVEAWLREQLRIFAAKYPIKVLTVTTHGASFVCVGKDGLPAVPVLSYTFEPGEAFHEEFYRAVGDRDELQRTTATLELKALINPGKGLFFAQQRYPAEFANVRTILFYPQYWGFRLTGEIAADYTYVGCHTYLWDFAAATWSAVADRLGVRDLLPRRIGGPWEILGRVTPEVAEATGLDPSTVVTLGLHDSNSSLLPHLIKRTGSFVLNSTGTWCVAMHPVEKVTFAPDEIGKAVFYNISPLGKPVKTSILMGGHEFEVYSDLLKKICTRTAFPSFNREIYERIIREKRLFILPGVVAGSGQFPHSKPRVVENGTVYPLKELHQGKKIPDFMKDFETGYAVLNLSLALQTRVALERVGLGPGVKLFTEGGFRNNADYNALVSSCFPRSPHFLTNVREATSFGAALVSRLAVEGGTLADLAHTFEIEDREVDAVEFEGLEEYSKAFFEIL
ncbi:MAG TPA: FGGY family carbohydrate kinase [Spirochaetia bacterium]|nr:FGGY family carbohydrate kinase [Spirochaetia bacterium]